MLYCKCSFCPSPRSSNSVVLGWQLTIQPKKFNTVPLVLILSWYDNPASSPSHLRSRMLKQSVIHWLLTQTLLGCQRCIAFIPLSHRLNYFSRSAAFVWGLYPHESNVLGSKRNYSALYRQSFHRNDVLCCCFYSVAYIKQSHLVKTEWDMMTYQGLMEEKRVPNGCGNSINLSGTIRTHSLSRSYRAACSPVSRGGLSPNDLLLRVCMCV